MAEYAVLKAVATADEATVATFSAKLDTRAMARIVFFVMEKIFTSPSLFDQMIQTSIILKAGHPIKNTRKDICQSV